MGKRHYERERYYETVFVVKPTLTEEEYKQVVEAPLKTKSPVRVGKFSTKKIGD